MKKAANKQVSCIARILIGITAAIFILIGSISITAVLVLNETVQEKHIGIALAFCIFISSFVGCILGCRKDDSNNVVQALGTMVGFVVILFILHFLLFSGRFSNVLGTVLPAACGAILSFFVVNTKKGRRYKQIKKYRFG